MMEELARIRGLLNIPAAGRREASSAIERVASVALELMKIESF